MNRKTLLDGTGSQHSERSWRAVSCCAYQFSTNSSLCLSWLWDNVGKKRGCPVALAAARCPQMSTHVATNLWKVRCVTTFSMASVARLRQGTTPANYAANSHPVFVCV